MWSLLDPFTWKRKVIDQETGESYGQCESTHKEIFMGPLVALMTISTGACAFMACKTKDVDDRFSESNWIFYTIFTQIQVLLVGIPLLFVLGNASADATYLGRGLLVFVVVFTVLILMVGPKVMRKFRGDKDGSRSVVTPHSSAEQGRSTRGRSFQRGSISRGSVKITGIHSAITTSAFSIMGEEEEEEDVSHKGRPKEYGVEQYAPNNAPTQETEALASVDDGYGRPQRRVSDARSVASAPAKVTIDLAMNEHW
eukprot:CAMPEP_0118723420 /NCGR_PEP_ID=MMETSP0800-20121206/31993_1 /TAXON_ID=210618 ORGANISM="Striatella unipunctata, Strain CCMP2910" /NCGR_SAMPLE_ID=MMETSP0800 /ASSEMBLY_ACC=CAM_ASM_000638 /LENGTH=254 /DNA_ID=CAMNT_0006631843 /DNA_START=277 /DNA_END=1038 /DNA_ORIENTATION=+